MSKVLVLKKIIFPEKSSQKKRQSKNFFHQKTDFGKRDDTFSTFLLYIFEAFLTGFFGIPVIRFITF